MAEHAQRFEVVHTDPDTRIVRRKVIPYPSEEFDELVVKLFDPNNNDYTGNFVPNDTPLGERGRGKVFHYRLKSSHYQDVTINYEIKDGVTRFIDFNGITVDGYKIGTRKSEDGDLLEVDLKKSKFAPTDGKEVNRIRYVLWAIQRFNNELLEEAGTEDDDELEETDESEDKPEETRESNDGDVTFGKKPDVL